ncbi:hypothetical protein [Vibrio alginolyticus]|uniref:hypothetical protein n=1 Tax=Vibrio alginolyticus TaxID=663 RepID=UPI00072201A0|nr:hypothetical protein [Vibrio alginolyticus]ALR95700.1 hypothetical protein AT730_26020 [Vibrio alginolyticus]MBY7710708.1 hypothetical protein [Vibrio alginolyticus]
MDLEKLKVSVEKFSSQNFQKQQDILQLQNRMIGTILQIRLSAIPPARRSEFDNTSFTNLPSLLTKWQVNPNAVQDINFFLNEFETKFGRRFDHISLKSVEKANVLEPSQQTINQRLESCITEPVNEKDAIGIKQQRPDNDFDFSR